MPLYMDRHDLQAVTAEDIAAAHIKDLEVQARHGVRYMTYWFDTATTTVFCLADAPTMEAAVAVHRESHGLIAYQMIEVDGRAVIEFLGKIQEPNPGDPWVATAFRTILFTDLEGSTKLTERLGDAKAIELMRTHDVVVRGELSAHAGTEIDHAGDGIMASFLSVVRAVECAVAIQRALNDHNTSAAEPLRVRMGLSAGEPVTASDRLFGSVINLAARACAQADGEQIFATSVIRDLCIGKGFTFHDRGDASLKGFDEPVRIYEVDWQPT